jgi:hypothetical protein
MAFVFPGNWQQQQFASLRRPEDSRTFVQSSRLSHATGTEDPEESEQSDDEHASCVGEEFDDFALHTYAEHEHEGGWTEVMFKHRVHLQRIKSSTDADLRPNQESVHAYCMFTSVFFAFR